VLSLVQFLPEKWLEWFIASDLSSRLKEVHRMTRRTTEIMRDFVRGKGKAQGKDIISLIMKANANEDKRLQLSEDEMLDQLRCVPRNTHVHSANGIRSDTFSLLTVAGHGIYLLAS
jgi:hypothetical protein